MDCDIDGDIDVEADAELDIGPEVIEDITVCKFVFVIEIRNKRN